MLPASSYTLLHKQLGKARGRAADQPCAGCGEPAVEWSYDHSDPDEVECVRKGRLIRFSLDVERYQPLCRPCHYQRDREHWTECLVQGCRTRLRHSYCWAHRPRAGFGTGLGRGNNPNSRMGLAMGQRPGDRGPVATDENGRAWTRSDAPQRSWGPHVITRKTCRACKVEKPVASFSTRGRDALHRRDPFTSICLACDRIRAKARHAKRREVAV